MADLILIKDIQAFSRVGIYDAERVLGQTLFIDLELEVDLSKAAVTNDIADTVNYVEVAIKVREIAQSKEYLLIENLANEIVLELLASFSLIQGITIELNKTIVNAEKFSGKSSIRFNRKR